MLDLVDSNPVDSERYGVYTYRTSTEDGLVYARSFIVLKNDYGIVRFTRLHEFAGFKNYKPITSDAEGKLYHKGHHWQCSVQVRQKGTGCPYCAGKVHRGSLLI